MCIIIDASVAGVAFSSTPVADAIPVLKWISSGDGKLAYGGILAKELLKVNNFRRWLIAQRKAGNAIRYPDEDIKRELDFVEPNCRSNDPHIIALARVSGARVLFSHDRMLQQDFTNTTLVRNPKGKVYQRSEHEPLLRFAPGCHAIPS